MSNDKIVLRDYSKIVFMYPTLIMSIIAWAISLSFGESMLWLQTLWTAVFFANILIIAFDFAANKLLVLFLILGILGGLFWYFLYTPFNVYLGQKGITLGYTIHFYILMSIMLGFLILVAFLSTLFDYYVIERNELYHRIGIFTRAERYAISNVSFDKDIPDIFEYFLFGAGQLTFYPEGGRRLVRLNTVLRINHKEEKINDLLSKISVDDD